MTNAYERSKLWRRTLGPDSPYALEHPEAAMLLRGEFIRMRDKAELLTSRISADMPDYPLHDITHLDALWQIADEIVDESFELNPIEAFILGGSILLHDAGMTLAAYPGGLSDLKKTAEWRDAIAVEWYTRFGAYPDRVDSVSDPDIVRAATKDTLRRLHSAKAKDLATQKWLDANGTAEYLIQDTKLRNSYGEAIGEIAQSHGADISALEGMRVPVNAVVGFPVEWDANKIKIACLLRCADAAHLDERRVPHFLHTIAQPADPNSRLHWAFQDGLAPPKRDGDALRYTRGSAVPLEREAAWWKCFECICDVDKELKSCSQFLADHGLEKFAARRVLGAESSTAMCAFIPTAGWDPVSAKVSASDVLRIIHNLGGKQLYGDDPWVPLREMIQNATDAVRVRAQLEEDWYGRSRSEGRVTISLSGCADGITMEIADNGVGMSKSVLTGALIDFGKSLWFSDEVRVEFPGLTGSRFRSTGKFGIGFFSIFTIAETVRVISRRFERGPETTKVLEFPKDAFSRPRLRDATLQERDLAVTTRVIVKLSEAALARIFLRSADIKFLSVKLDHLASKVRAQIKSISLMTDCGIVLQSGESEATAIVDRNEWLTASNKEILSIVFDSAYLQQMMRLWFGWGSGIDVRALEDRMRPIYDLGGRIAGRAAALPCIYSSKDTLLTYSGGFSSGYCADDLGDFALGVIQADRPNVSRSSAAVDVKKIRLGEWATEQAKLWSGASKPSIEVYLAANLYKCGGDLCTLKTVRWGEHYLTGAEVRAKVATLDRVLVYRDLLPPVFRQIGAKGERELEYFAPQFLMPLFAPAPEIVFLPTANLQDLASRRTFTLGRWSDRDVFDEHFTKVLGNSDELGEIEGSTESDEDRLIRHELEEWPVLISTITKIASYLGIPDGYCVHLEEDVVLGTIKECEVPGSVIVFERRAI